MLLDLGKQSYRNFTAEELRAYAAYAASGVLVINGYDIEDLFEYVLQGVYTEDEMEKENKSSYDAGYESGTLRMIIESGLTMTTKNPWKVTS